MNLHEMRVNGFATDGPGSKMPRTPSALGLTKNGSRTGSIASRQSGKSVFSRRSGKSGTSSFNKFNPALNKELLE
jgi:hypothetical protein